MLAAGRRFSADDLIAMAANYSIPQSEWAAADPATWVAEPFLASIALRYTSLARVDPFCAVLTFAERLARG